jgi:phosphoglycolate phosphatase
VSAPEIPGRGSAPRLIVFDLDGTLVESGRDLAASANELIVALGGAPLPENAVVGMVGDGAAALVARALAAAGLPPGGHETLTRFLEIYDRRLLEHTRPYAGVPELLEALARTSALAVLTNKPGAASRKLLGGLGLLDRFTRVIGGDEAPRKPDPSGLLLLMRSHEADPGSTWLVGDSSIDLETARRAGVPAVLARYGFGFAGIAAGIEGVAVIDRPLELRGVLGL